jgi:hypothetical protein
LPKIAIKLPYRMRSYSECSDLLRQTNKIPYYFKYKKPSNLRHIQFLNVAFRGEKLERYTFLEFKSHLNFSMRRKCVKCASYI